MEHGLYWIKISIPEGALRETPARLLREWEFCGWYPAMYDGYWWVPELQWAVEPSEIGSRITPPNQSERTK